jgi:hypothetical protein
MRLTSSLQQQQAVGLSDPVCAPEHRRMMAEAFLREHPDGIFVQVGVGVGVSVGMGEGVCEEGVRCLLTILFCKPVCGLGCVCVCVCVCGCAGVIVGEYFKKASQE